MVMLMVMVMLLAVGMAKNIILPNARACAVLGKQRNPLCENWVPDIPTVLILKSSSKTIQNITAIGDSFLICFQINVAISGH